MYTLDALRSNIARLVSEITEVAIEPAEIVFPPNKEMGDFAYGCFRLAKERKANPAELAKVIASKIKSGDHGVESASAEGPYVNFKLNGPLLVHRVLHEVLENKEKYGSSRLGLGKEVMLEYANLNSHKEFHVGHLRNILYGLSVYRLLDFSGYKTIPVSYINDMGVNVSKCIWLLVRQGSAEIAQIPPKLKKGEKEKPFVPMPADIWSSYVITNMTMDWAKAIIDNVPAKDRTGKYLGNIYAESTKLLDENEDFKKEVSLIQANLEKNNNAWKFLWQETRRWSLQELYHYLQDFGVVLKRQYLESEFTDVSKKVVEKLISDGIAIESDGAIIVDLDAYPDPDIQKQKLGVFMLRKSDGNMLYATKDIPLAEKKLEEYPKMDESLLVVDTRQAHYFKQLFAVLKIMGYNIPLKHLGYEFVTLPEGAMSSRKGTVITLQDFIARAIELAEAQVTLRHKDWNQGKVDHTSWCIAMGGIIFTMLKQDPEKAITFEMDKALAFEGDTGPYVQYSITRLNSILEKAKVEDINSLKGDASFCKEPAEKNLALVIARLPEAYSRAALEYKPSILAHWCLDTASAINAFYRDIPVLDAAPELRDARLRLAAAAKIALQNGLHGLAIPIPDAM
ncbi:MAG: arginine--tRNA ligase [Patescibacteria group bacterium]|nr:arginine--tRNA ligase [Patescibacteria group bacterium]